MLGCNTVCPKCRHEFTCCPPTPTPCCITSRRSLHGLSGGGLITAPSTQPPSCRSPQASPSVPLAFVLPFPPLLAASLQQEAARLAAATRPETELERLSKSLRLLRASGWYHEGLTWRQSQDALKDTEPGTFLIRDSSDQRFLYSLSVQTEQGPTSVRLHYVDGKFRLDSEPYLAPLMPVFDTVIDLIVHYVRCSASTPSRSSGTGGQVWVDSKGCMFSRILLKKPLYRADKVPKLKHLARLAVHRALEASATPRIPLLLPPHKQLELPASLTDYLADYPYSM